MPRNEDNGSASPRYGDKRGTTCSRAQSRRGVCLEASPHHSTYTSSSSYADIFHLKGETLGATHIIEHAIYTKDDAPINAKPYRFPAALREELHRQINEIAREKLVAAKLRAKYYYDKKANAINFKVGDSVWLLRGGREREREEELRRLEREREEARIQAQHTQSIESTESAEGEEPLLRKKRPAPHIPTAPPCIHLF
ncbi:unnamed protein product, partial [Trichogramma brassicae]